MITIHLFHSKLKRSGDSDFKSECPFCKEGIFLMRRDQKTFELLDEDFCIGCGAHVVYKDFNTIFGKYGPKPKKKTRKKK